MEQKPRPKGKARELIIGFFGWFLIGNLILWLFSFLLFDLFFLIISNSWLTGLITLLVVGFLFSKKRHWIGYGVLAAVITNTGAWIALLGFDWVWLLFGLTIPLPFGLAALGQ